MVKKIFKILMLGVIFLTACNKSEQIQLKRGDLLFCGKTPSPLSEAIDDVTSTDNGKHFSHVGIVDVDDGQINVIHASGKKGVCKESLDSFLIDDHGMSLYVEAYRLKPECQFGIENAVKRARSAIGEPYNYTYLIEDSGYYCSELIWWAFLPDSVFKLNPMTFKDSRTGKFHKGWIDHYKALEAEIPEGKPGCNPNGMAGSDKIYFLGVLDDQ